MFSGAIYDSRFYANQRDESVSSAEVIVPILLSHVSASSVVDIGCGTGTWLRIFERHGISDYLGLDGDYVPRDALQIPRDRFRATDLRQLSDAGRGFDIACSLEVAEHLPPACSERFVKLLTSAAPVVLFSASIPHQGGTGHVNEQWQSYWCELFRARGFAPFDWIRPRIYGDRRVAWWYRQNVLVFCDREYAATFSAAPLNAFYLDRIDPGMIEAMRNPQGIRNALGAVRRDISALMLALVNKVSMAPTMPRKRSAPT
jgi:SAM-dependent methyltransferase